MFCRAQTWKILVDVAVVYFYILQVVNSSKVVDLEKAFRSAEGVKSIVVDFEKEPLIFP